VTDLSERKFALYVDFLKRVELLGDALPAIPDIQLTSECAAPLAEYERKKIAEALEEESVSRAINIGQAN
jgi:hypothetical protein